MKLLEYSIDIFLVNKVVINSIKFLFEQVQHVFLSFTQFNQLFEYFLSHAVSRKLQI